MPRLPYGRVFLEVKAFSELRQAGRGCDKVERTEFLPISGRQKSREAPGIRRSPLCVRVECLVRFLGWSAELPDRRGGYDFQVEQTVQSSEQR